MNRKDLLHEYDQHISRYRDWLKLLNFFELARADDSITVATLRLMLDALQTVKPMMPDNIEKRIVDTLTGRVEKI